MNVCAQCLGGKQVNPEGAPGSKIFILGEAPGSKEELLGRPFIGGAGQVLNRAIQVMKMNREDFYISNTVLCRPPGNRDPKLGEIAMCSPFLEEVMKVSRPKVIIALGYFALLRLMGLGYPVAESSCSTIKGLEESVAIHKTKKEEIRVRNCFLNNSEIVVVPCVHPAYIMRGNWGEFPVLVRALEKARKIADGEIQPFTDTELHLFPSQLALEGLVSEVMKQDVFSIDLETHQNEITLVGIGWKVDRTFKAMSLPFLYAGGIVKDLLRSNKVKVAHNWMYDATILKRNGISVQPPVFDTIVAAALHQPDIAVDLGAAAGFFLDWVEPWKSKKNNMYRYNALDVLNTMRLHEVLKEKGETFCFKNTMKALQAFVQPSAKGIRVDCEERKQVKRKTGALVKGFVEDFSLAYGGTNPFSTKQLGALLAKSFAIKLPFTKKGNMKVDITSLQKIVEKHPETAGMIMPILEARQRRQLSSTFLSHRSERVYPSYSFHSTGTGRMTSQKPNMFNIPEEVRKIFVPDNGFYFLEADYSQIELRITAQIAQDEGLIQAFRDGEDVHELNAKRIGIDRKTAKTVIYGISYGIGARKLAEQLQVPLVRAKQVLEDTFRVMPGLLRFRKKVEETVLRDRMLITAYGRIRRFFDESQLPAAYDFYPQGTTSDIILESIGILYDEFPHYQLVTSVYDSLLLAIPENEPTDVAEWNVRKVMERELPEIAPGFFVPIDVKIGMSWGFEKG